MLSHEKNRPSLFDFVALNFKNLTKPILPISWKALRKIGIIPLSLMQLN